VKLFTPLLPLVLLGLACSRFDEDGLRIPGASLSSMGAHPTLGAAMDGLISDRVREAILADRTLAAEASTVRVSTTDGVVTLRGSVSSAPRKERFGILANSVGSVVGVENELVVSSQPTVAPRPMETAVDRAVSDRVRSAFAEDAVLSKEAEIRVSSQGGIVTLTGAVSGPSARDRATIVANAVGSVVRVENRLSTPPE
jgi:hyperosmotically inducible protein